MNFLDFMLNTYEGQRKGEDRNQGDEGGDGDDLIGRRQGRPMNERVSYSADAKKGDRCRIIRSDGHETIPRFVGKWFERNDSESQLERNLYYSSMLLLLKPWTNLKSLKLNSETFEGNFRAMVEAGDEKTHRVIHNIQYYHECEDGAKAKNREERENPGAYKQVEIEQEEIDLMDFDEQGYGYQNGEPRVITEEDIELARTTRTPAKERLSAQAAIWQAIDSGIFSNDSDNGNKVKWKPLARRTNETETYKIRAWKKQLMDTTRLLARQTGSTDLGSLPTVSAGSSKEPLNPAPSVPYTSKPTVEVTGVESKGRSRPEKALLNEEQRMAHDIIEAKLLAKIESKYGLN